MEKPLPTLRALMNRQVCLSLCVSLLLDVGIGVRNVTDTLYNVYIYINKE